MKRLYWTENGDRHHGNREAPGTRVTSIPESKINSQ
jgi:hypothetical protein